MASDTNRPEVIDADGHVVEPDTVWKEYAEPAYRDRLDRPGGGVQELGMQHAYPEAILARRMQAEPDESWAADVGDDSWDEESRTKMARPGGYDPHARLVDMDDEGIDVAVLYPTSMLTWVEDADLFGAACRAYNNWLRDYCAAAPSRLYGVGVVPLQDIDAAIVEMRRCLEQLDFKAIMLRPAAYRGDKKLNHPDYDPFWQAAAEIGCPIGIHPSPHPDMQSACRLLGLADRDDQPGRGSRPPAGPVQRARPPDGGRAVRPRRRLRTPSRAPRGVPRRHRRLDRADARAVRPPVRDLRQSRPALVAERGLRPAVRDQLRSRRGRARRSPRRSSAPTRSSGPPTTRTPTPRSPAW